MTKVARERVYEEQGARSLELIAKGSNLREGFFK